MRALRRGIALSLLVLALPAAADAASLNVTPTRVDFGTVPVNDPDCQIVNDVPSAGCATATVTITNAGASATHFESASACQRIFHNASSTCITQTAGWGGFVGDPTSTCFTDWTLRAGESCTVTLVAHPSRRGTIRGYFIMREQGGAIEVSVPVRVRGT